MITALKNDICWMDAKEAKKYANLAPLFDSYYKSEA
jgi:hypothetical protein